MHGFGLGVHHHMGLASLSHSDSRACLYKCCIKYEFCCSINKEGSPERAPSFICRWDDCYGVRGVKTDQFVVSPFRRFTGKCPSVNGNDSYISLANNNTHILCSYGPQSFISTALHQSTVFRDIRLCNVTCFLCSDDHGCSQPLRRSSPPAKHGEAASRVADFRCTKS